MVGNGGMVGMGGIGGFGGIGGRKRYCPEDLPLRSIPPRLTARCPPLTAAGGQGPQDNTSYDHASMQKRGQDRTHLPHRGGGWISGAPSKTEGRPNALGEASVACRPALHGVKSIREQMQYFLGHLQ